MTEVPLGSVAEILMGTAPPGETYNSVGDGLPMIAGAGDYGERFPEPKQWTTAPSRIAEVGDLIICVRATIGDLNWADKRYCLGRGVGALRPHPGKLDISYLAHYMTVAKAKLERFGSGSTFPAIRRCHLEDFPIPLPPLAEQKRIAAVLDKADDLRTKRRQALATLDTLLQSVFLDMFGDPVTNPKGWPKAELQSITTAIIDCPHTTPRWTESGVLALRTSNLGYGEWQWEDTRYVDETQYVERSKRGELEAGDIVLSREGTVGIAAIVPQKTKMCMGQRLVQVKSHRSKAIEQYLLYVLLYELAPERISGVMAGSTSKHLNVVELRELRIPIPSLSVQKRFATFLDSIKRQRKNAVDAASQLDKLFASLQSAAFTGTLFPGDPRQTVADSNAKLTRHGHAADDHAKARTRGLIGRHLL